MALGQWFSRLIGRGDRADDGMPRCHSCRASPPLQHQRDMRIGAVYSCPSCGRSFHLSSDYSERTGMPAEDSALVAVWNAEPLLLSPEDQAALIRIGASPTHPSPPNRETPCAVTTVSGAYIPCAIVREQDYPPVHHSPHEMRLGGEIASVEPSPYALPLAVRRSVANPIELGPNVYESSLVMPDGSWLTGGGGEVFLMHPDFDATEAQPVPQDREPPADARHVDMLQPETVIVFIVDPFTKPKQRRAD